MKHLILTLILFVHITLGCSQSLLNGSFENTPANVDIINTVESIFNENMPYTVSFGSFDNIDIVTSDTYCGLAQDGNWYVALTAGGSDAMSMELSSPLEVGQEYTISFWDRGCDGQYSTGPQPVIVGMSNSPISVGTPIYIGPMPTVGAWEQRSFVFTATEPSTYMTITLTSSGTQSDTGYWTQVDHFELTNSLCPEILSLGNDLVLCPGDSAVFNMNIPDATYLWQDGSTESSYISYNAEEVYVTATSGFCTYTDTVVVNAANPAEVELGPDMQLCEGDSVILDIDFKGATYLWQDGNTSGTYTVTESGQYSVVVTQGTCTTQDEIQINFDQAIELELGNDTTICEGTQISLGYEFENAEYAWSTGATGPYITVDATGIYGVEVTQGACFVFDIIDINVVALPEASMSYTVDGTTVQFLNTSTNAIDQNWDFGDDSGSDEFNPVHEYDESGTFEVTLVVTSEFCGIDSTTETISVVGLEELPNDMLSIYPNPATEMLQIVPGNLVDTKLFVEIFEASGKLVYNQQYNAGTGIIRIDLTRQPFSSGIYTVQVSTGKGVARKKIVVVRE